ncbi:MAG: hypothetical protein EHM59_15210 [Betaproteobacteria bacterium]|nr:MAG: hypothetical protein EHM59_15210 [Betaproteobacteria bacterium]
MKLAFIVHNEHYTGQVMALLAGCQIDYYTRWERVMGKGHQTEPHLGTGTYANLNGVLMIGFEDEAPLQALISAIEAANAEIKRRSDHIRLFQLPLERIV